MCTIPRCSTCGKTMKWLGRAQCSGEGGVMGIDHFHCGICKKQDTILLSGRSPCHLPTTTGPATADIPKPTRIAAPALVSFEDLSCRLPT